MKNQNTNPMYAWRPTAVLGAQDLLALRELAEEMKQDGVENFSYTTGRFQLFVYADCFPNTSEYWTIEPCLRESNCAYEPCGESRKVPNGDIAQLLVVCAELTEEYGC
jgi:hypothetical protein